MKRGSNVRFRREVFDAHKRVDERGTYLPCAGIRADGTRCGVHLYPARGDKWWADHTHALAAGGKDDAASNGQPLCELCNSRKTYTEDAPEIAKVRQTRDKHFGMKAKRGWYRPPGYKHQWGKRDD